MVIKEILGQLSALLFLPVMVLLLVLFAWTLIASGRFLRQLVARMRGQRPAVNRYVAEIDAAASRTENDADLAIEALIQRAESEAARRLQSVRFAIRAGPSLGLMGTLIPMATALGGLASGDLPGLASNMAVAFSSTVVGIAIGLLAYAVTVVEEGWCNSDLDAIRLHAERASRTTGEG